MSTLRFTAQNRFFTLNLLSSWIRALLSNSLLAWLLLAAVVFSPPSQAVRLVDLVDIEGVRRNQLIGYGMVVGLQGTGDQTRQTVFTSQSMVNMLRQFGIQLPPGSDPRMKNVAAVSISANLPTFARPGTTLDVVVSSIGDAKSLRGGVLLASPLRGIDGQVYALAQGSVIVGGVSAQGATGTQININITTVGRIPGGATIEQSIIPPEITSGVVRLNLREQNYSQSRILVKAINDHFGSHIARGVDGSQIEVTVPEGQNNRVTFLSMLETLDVPQGVTPARVVINSRTGTIVIGADVRIRPVAVSNGSTTVKVMERPSVIQPNPFSLGTTQIEEQSTVDIIQKTGGMFIVPATTSLSDIVNVVNSAGLTPNELISILQAIHEAGAMEGELVIM
ncbi:flagellar basal body P-ring protein FlgI [Endozoicomonas sp. YOMI1]|uniref:flagellar basal body P-ring protein FlgI n=1 Tax=Endozoicomonas sp. YOMI1 TaxID=2828739 RepID=UPI0021472012|nr:flagellar basal body P-ring protein FlgI [Endozoicomonas sp. YOMI1]